MDKKSLAELVNFSVIRGSQYQKHTAAIFLDQLALTLEVCEIPQSEIVTLLREESQKLNSDAVEILCTLNKTQRGKHG